MTAAGSTPLRSSGTAGPTDGTWATTASGILAGFAGPGNSDRLGRISGQQSLLLQRYAAR